MNFIQISLLLNGYIHNSLLYIKSFEKIISPKPCYYPKYINASDKPIEWYWPTISKVIIDSNEGKNPGIDISGIKGEPIFSIAKGKVVYTGKALRGYGNLIIIKHDNNYLSTYAHNDTIIVFAQEEIQSGQKIATMGSTGTSSVRLHLEIYYKGYAINPMRFF